MTRSLLITAAALLSGCTAFEISRPSRAVSVPVSLPTLWSQSSEGTEGKIATGWLSTFRDPKMEALVAEAMAQNHDIRASAARLKSTREGTIIGRANRLPSVSVSGSGSRSGSRSKETDGDLGPWEQNTNYGLSWNASWEVDLWGRLRDLEEASVENYIGARADFRGARLSLAANTAKAWCNLITAARLVESAEQTLVSFEGNFKVTERLFKGAGDGNALNVIFGRNNVASAERSLRDRRLAKEEAARSLEVLLGRYPHGSIQEGEALPTLADDVPAGLPSELLMRRPDLVSAAADLRASAARADAARKSLLPSIRLSGGGSSASDDLLNVLADPRSIGWNVASSLAQTVYRGGALSAQAKQTLAQNEASIEQFASVALRAFREVESALARERNLAMQATTTALEVETANKAEQLADRGFQEQLVTPLELLEARRRVISARNAMISLVNQRLQNRIDLHLALGGDFATQPSDPMASIPTS